MSGAHIIQGCQPVPRLGDGKIRDRGTPLHQPNPSGMVLQETGDSGDRHIRIGVRGREDSNPADHGPPVEPTIPRCSHPRSDPTVRGQQVGCHQRVHSPLPPNEAPPRTILPLHQGGRRIGHDIVPPPTGTPQPSVYLEQTLGILSGMDVPPTAPILAR